MFKCGIRAGVVWIVLLVRICARDRGDYSAGIKNDRDGIKISAEMYIGVRGVFVSKTDGENAEFRARVVWIVSITTDMLPHTPKQICASTITIGSYLCCKNHVYFPATDFYWFSVLHLT